MYKVAVCGGSGGIGQPLCMLIAQNPRIKTLSVIDVSMAMTPAAGVAADLSHMTDLDFEASCNVKGYGIDPKVNLVFHMPLSPVISRAIETV